MKKQKQEQEQEGFHFLSDKKKVIGNWVSDERLSVYDCMVGLCLGYEVCH